MFCNFVHLQGCFLNILEKYNRKKGKVRINSSAYGKRF